MLAGVIAWGGWQLGGKDRLGHANLALKIGAVFVPAGIAGGIYWLTGADVQNSGGEGNDRVRAGEIQKGGSDDLLVVQDGAAVPPYHQISTVAVQPLSPNCDLNFSARFSAAARFSAMANVVEPLPDMSAHQRAVFAEKFLVKRSTGNLSNAGASSEL